MNAKNIFKQILFIAGFLMVGTTLGFGQGIFGNIKEKVESKVKKEVKNQSSKATGAGSFCFARIEVRSSWEERGKKSYETRVYYSQVSTYKSGDAKMVENLWKYFDEGVAAPLKAKGIELKFYDSDITIYPASYSFETTQEAQTEMDKKMENDKEAKYAIYKFNWKYNATPNGEETTQPKRIFGVKTPPKSENAVIEASTN